MIEDNIKKIIQLRSELKLLETIDGLCDDLMNGKLEVEDFVQEIYSKRNIVENEIDNLKCEMNIPDEHWDDHSENNEISLLKCTKE